jgi:hypothetical protein
MKIYGNLDIGGNLKIRNTINDRVLVEGGFYSGQFGEVAYKTDVPIEIVGSNFYGMTIKYPDNSVSYRDIDTVILDVDSFYLKQNVPNTDEIQVNLRNTYNNIIGSSNVPRVVRSTTITPMMFFTIPANTLKVGSLLKMVGFFASLNASGVSRFPTYTLQLNGATVFDDAGTARGTNTIHLEVITVYVAILSPTNAFMAVQPNVGNDVQQTFGQGAMEGAITTRGFMADEAVALDITVSNTIGLALSWTVSSTQTFRHYFSYAELIS